MTSLTKTIRAINIILVVFYLGSCSDNGEPPFLDDRAGLLDQEQKKYLNDYNSALLRDLDIHFKLIILKDRAADIDELAAAAFGNLGDETSGARGLLFLVDPLGKQARIEVGYDLEGVFTDGFVGYVEEKQMVPFFEADQVGIGVAATTELLVSRIQRSLAGDQIDPLEEIGAQRYFSGGGGAKVAVNIGSERKQDRTDVSGLYQAQASPEETLKEYMLVLRKHEKNPKLGLFTPETRDFFSRWVVTDGQQDNELRSLKEGTPGKVFVSGSYAVIRYPPDLRTRPPYFLEKGSEGWMLDFWTMSTVIQMNHKNYYRFKSLEHPYRFAFEDWHFDKNGFPVIPR